MKKAEKRYDDAEVQRQLSRVPKFSSVDDALADILKFATDKREHLLLSDCVEWLELKMKAIAKIARQARKLNAAQKPQDQMT